MTDTKPIRRRRLAVTTARRRAAVIVTLTLIAFTLGGYTVHVLSTRATSEATRANKATVSAEQLCEQVRMLGATCVVDPSSLPKGDPGATGPIGPAGAPGATGASGRPGATGRGLVSVICISGRWRVQYTDGTVDSSAGPCTGPAGVAGASGAQGPAGPAGADGKNGADGKDGTNGADGAPGAPGAAPASWSWTNTLGVKYTCTRDPGSSDTAPTYTCGPASPSP